MRSIAHILTIWCILLPAAVCNAHIDNAATVTVKIQGNCGMCESTIEKAGSLKNFAEVDWNKDTKQAVITYDARRTNTDEILKKIALAGYDNEKFLAPGDVYARLPECCQYERQSGAAEPPAMEMHTGHNNSSTGSTDAVIAANDFQAVTEAYFLLKDALVKSDAPAAAGEAKVLSDIINTIKEDQLDAEEHIAWMKVKKDLVSDAGQIRNTKDIAGQRGYFMRLSQNMYALLKAAPQNAPVYYQLCPMADNGKGANWLSKEKEIRNPYYGSQMLTCGKVAEVINDK